MVGYGLMLAATKATMEFGAVVADSAVGGAVGAIPISLGLVCVLACCCVASGGLAVAADVESGSPASDGLVVATEVESGSTAPKP